MRRWCVAGAVFIAAAACQTKRADEKADEPAAAVDDTAAAGGEAWAQVVAWAKPTVEPGDATLFARAVELAAAHTKAVRDAKRDAREYRVEPGVLPDAVDEAVEALVAWSRAGDGLAVGSCDGDARAAMSEVLVAYEIARAALLTAPDDPDHPRVRAVLYLGHRLRGEGKSALEIGVGMALGGAAVEWAKARGLKAGRSFRDFAPEDGLVFRALAAEAVCQVALVAAGGREDQTIGTQLAAVRAFNSETVHGAFRRRDDTKALEAYLLARAEQGRKQADTPILRTFSPTARVAIDIRKERDVVRRFVTNGN